MTEKNLVSIIIPTFNRADLLVETLDSIIEQTYKNWECLVIDDGSTDHTEDIISHYSTIDPRIIYYKRPPIYASGGNGARNYGLDLAKGEYINWFDSDDIMWCSFLHDKIEAITANYNFAISSHQIADNNLKVQKSIDLEIKYNLFKDYIFWKDNFCIGTPNILFRKDFLILNNYRFNEQIKRGQEAELFSRIFYRARKEDFTIIKNIGYIYRQHDDSKSKQSQIYNQEFVKNVSDIFLMNLNYSLQLKDRDLYLFILSHLFKMLFNSKKKSRDNYFRILKGISIYAPKKIKWYKIYFVLVVYFYLPSSTRFQMLLSNSVQDIF